MENIDFITRLPKDVLLNIFDKVQEDESDAPFFQLSMSCKRFYRVLHRDERTLSRLRCQLRPDVVRAVRGRSCRVLRRAANSNNHRAKFLLAFYYTFNSKFKKYGMMTFYYTFNSKFKKYGMMMLKEIEYTTTWMHRYVMGMAEINAGVRDYNVEILVGLIMEMNEKDIGLRTCQIDFRSMLRRKWRKKLVVTECCSDNEIGHWHPKKVDTIYDHGELDISCAYCSIDIETFKLRYNLH